DLLDARAEAGVGDGLRRDLPRQELDGRLGDGRGRGREIAEERQVVLLALEQLVDALAGERHADAAKFRDHDPAGRGIVVEVEDGGSHRRRYRSGLRGLDEVSAPPENLSVIST